MRIPGILCQVTAAKRWVLSIIQSAQASSYNLVYTSPDAPVPFSLSQPFLKLPIREQIPIMRIRPHTVAADAHRIIPNHIPLHVGRQHLLHGIPNRQRLATSIHPRNRNPESTLPNQRPLSNRDILTDKLYLPQHRARLAETLIPGKPSRQPFPRLRAVPRCHELGWILQVSGEGDRGDAVLPGERGEPFHQVLGPGDEEVRGGVVVFGVVGAGCAVDLEGGWRAVDGVDEGVVVYLEG